MFAGSSPMCHSDKSKCGPTVKKKAHSPERTLLPLFSEKCFPTSSGSKDLFSFTSFTEDLPSNKPEPLWKPPHLIGHAGSQRAIAEAKWAEGLRPVTLALRAHTPTRIAQLKAESLAGYYESIDASEGKGRRKMKSAKGSKQIEYSMSGIEVFHLFAERKGLDELFYLKEVHEDTYRPYDLQVVPATDAGTDYYVFCPNSVVHVTATGFGGAVSLGDWYREYVLWTTLQRISFFRNFRMNKTFSSWHKTVRRIHFRRKCDELQDLLLLAVPQFRTALHLLSGVIEELQGINWMPLDESKSFSLLEFKKVLMTKNNECFLTLQRLSKYQAALMNSVKDESYENHTALQIQLKLSKKIKNSSEAIYQLLARRQSIKKQLAEAESILKKLGNFALLVHHIIMQNLATVVQQDANSFLKFFKKVSSQRRSVFYTELRFSANSQLSTDPPISEFHKALTNSFLRADTIVQLCDDLGFFLETSSKDCDSDQDLTSDEYSTATASLMVEGKKVNDYPLSKARLEWYVNINDVTKQVDTEHAKIIKDSELEIEQLYANYSWLKNIHLFVSQWSSALLETIKDQPASVYEELIKQLHCWAQRVQTVTPSSRTSNNLIVIHSTSTKQTLMEVLGIIKEEVQSLLVDQMKRQSETLIKELERMTAELRTKPDDVNDFSQFVFTVRELEKMLADMQRRLEYILSLRDTICMIYRKMTEEELALEEKVMRMWDNFIAHLKQADALVSQSLPTVTNALGTMFSYLSYDLRNIVLKATSGPFLDPSQNANEMVCKLKYMGTRVQTLRTKLEELSNCSQTMQEQQLDLASLAVDVKKILARGELWQLKAECTTWMEEWNLLKLSDVSVPQAMEKIILWKNQALSLTSIIPADDAVLEETSRILKKLSHQAEVLANLKKSMLKEKHWKILLQDMGLLDVQENNLTVGTFMSFFVSETHQTLLEKTCRDAQIERDLEKGLQMLCSQWKQRLFQLHELVLPTCRHCRTSRSFEAEEMFIGSIRLTVKTTQQCFCNGTRFSIVGLETYFTDIQKDLITLSTMMKSPHSVEFRLQLRKLAESLKFLDKLLDLFERFQQIWVFLTKTLIETSNCDRVDLLKHFQPVDEAFKKIMQSISTDPHVWTFLSSEQNRRYYGESFCKTLMDGLFTMEDISNRMEKLFQNFRERFPRLYFLSKSEIMQLLSFHPLVLKQQFFLRKCFKGVHSLEVDLKGLSHASILEDSGLLSENPKVLGVFGSLREHIAFQPPLESSRDIVFWLCEFEKHLKLSMVKLIKQCLVLRRQLEPVGQEIMYVSKVADSESGNADEMKDAHPLLDLFLDFPLQCLLVVEEAFCYGCVLKAFQEGSPEALNEIKTKNNLKLTILCNVIRNRVLGSENKSLISKYAMMCLRALVQLAMNHGQQLSRLIDLPGVPESSFEWLSMMKYHINTENESLDCSDNPSCYVDILGHHFQYGFEYYGPHDWLLVHTPTTDKATLGLVLALMRYRSGFMGGLSMSGRTNTVIQLGKALGQLVVVKECSPSTASGVVQRMLVGAIQAGAWLLLESVDLLSQGVLTVLQQLLSDIHHCYVAVQKKRNQKLTKKCETAPRNTGCIETLDPEYHSELLGKILFFNTSFGCVLTSSNQYASKIPDCLRFAARPVSLAHPDYRIVAEVTLASIGFLDALSLSHRLLCLITLIKDSECLPDLFNDNQSCFLVVLQKLISASEIYLHHAVRQREISIRDQVSDAEESDPLSVEKKETTKLPQLRKALLCTLQALMEETAIVKAILSVLTPEHRKASQFYTILKDTFPLAVQFPDFQKFIQEREKKQLQDAVVEELQEVHLCCDKEIIKQTLTLYQTLKFSQTVILIGPSGSGKTTCYSILAGALSRLASTSINSKGTSNGEAQIIALKWCYVDTVVLFPNAMSHSELFGCFCEERGWKDGAVAKVLKDSERYDRTCLEIFMDNIDSEETSLAKWLVLDGEPIGQPCWLDYLTTLCSPQDPHLCMSTGETILSPSQFSLLLEMTDLCDASPSVVTRCGLVYFKHTDVWKSIWNSEMDAISKEYKLDEGVQKMWKRLAQDLFSKTLSLLGQHGLTSVNNFESGSCENYGLQEITSFVRILRAVLLHFVRHPQKDKTDETDDPNSNAQNEQELLFRNFFLVAYVWAFGGHLHFRHWPKFDLLTRKVLFDSRYKIQVPELESLFEHFFSKDSKMNPNDMLSTNTVTPKFWTYWHLVDTMLETNQPVLIAGEPGSGRTTLSNSLSSFDLPHINIAASPLLTYKDLRLILKNICRQKYGKDVYSTAKPPSLLLFVEDLHDAPCDVSGRESTALEALRQCMSKGEIVTLDSYFLETVNSETVSYLTTSNISRLGDRDRESSGISLRLSRLFSIFVLPSLSEDAILSFHSAFLKRWLREMPLDCCVEKMSTCIVTATISLYNAVCDHFHPTGKRPFFIFSYHDIQKVFSGMYLWQHDILNTKTQKDRKKHSGFLPFASSTSVPILSIIHLWMHECIRTFGDRFCSEKEMNTFLTLVAKTTLIHYGREFMEGTQMDILEVEDIQQLLTVGQNVDSTQFHQRSIGGQSDLHNGQAESRAFSTEETSLESYTVGPELLKLIVEEMTRLVCAPEFYPATESVKHQPKIKRSSYQQHDFDVLQQKLQALIDREVDDIYSITNRYILHTQGMMQLLHILRALLLPGGHGVLIGSDRKTGRKTAVRLAAYITGYELIELDSSNETQFHDILKEAKHRTKLNDINTIILVHENVSPAVREEILMLMAQKASPVDYKEEKLSTHVFRVTSLKYLSRYRMESWINEKSFGKDYKNIHVFLLMSFAKVNDLPANKETQLWSTQLTKALKLSCCVEVYQTWSCQSLAELAIQSLKLCPLNTPTEVSEDTLSVAMAGIHQSSFKHSSIFDKSRPLIPTTYLEFIACFAHVYNKLYSKWQTKHDRITNALTRLDAVNKTSELCKQLLTRLQEQIDNAQKLESELLDILQRLRVEYEEAVERRIAGENKLNHMEKMISQFENLIQSIFLAGLDILNCLNQADLEEVRHYRDPPEGVVKMMDAMCLMFNRPAGWESTKHLLGQTNIFEELQFFDRSSMTSEQLAQLKEIIESPLFEPEAVREVSRACESLCRWIRAMYECCLLQHNVLLKRQLEAQAGSARRILHLLKKREREADNRLENYEQQLRNIRNELQDLQHQLYKAEDEGEEATRCAVRVAMLYQNWRALFQKLESRRQKIPGDALILSAAISYLGPFGAAVRTDLKDKWMELCRTRHIDVNPKDIRSSLFTDGGTETITPPPGFPIPVTENLTLPLGWLLEINDWQLEDTFSTRLRVKLFLWGYKEACIFRWPLLADSYQHFQLSSQKWFTRRRTATLEKELECDMVLCADDSDLIEKLDLAAEKGLAVLVTNVERAKPSPEFLAKLVPPNRFWFYRREQPPQPVHPDFRLFLSTPLPVRLLQREIDPSIFAEVLVVDLSLSSEEIRELLLTQLLQSDCKVLLMQHMRFLNYNWFLQEKLVSAEEGLMDYILQSKCLLFKDSNFLPRLDVYEEEMETLHDEKNKLREELDYQESLLADPRLLMNLGAALYQAVQSVSRLSSAYYFSLQKFRKVMQEAFNDKIRALTSFPTGKVGTIMLPEVMNTMAHYLLLNYRPRLFRRHFAVLKLLVSLEILEHNQLCTEVEKVIFLRGLKDIEYSEAEVKSLDLPSWIPSNVHSELILLEKIPCFNKLIDSLRIAPTQWQEYLCFTSSTIVGNVPRCSHSHLSLLQRAILWKTIRTDCLKKLGDAMNSCLLLLSSKKAAAPTSGDPDVLSEYLTRFNLPIIFTLPSTEGDMKISIDPLDFIRRMAHKDGNKEVRVITFGGLFGKEEILLMLDKASSEGHWLVFNNCDLLEKWDSEVLVRLRQLLPSLGEEAAVVHPCFRLWFVNKENTAKFLPVKVRVGALPLCFDSPSNLKEELSVSFRQVFSVSQHQSWPHVADDNMKVLLRCAIFHSVLMQRQTYKYLSFGRTYHWCQDDLIALLDAYISFTGQCHDKWNALRYIAAGVVYGGHIIDSADSELVESVAKCCFTMEPSLSGNGPAILSEMIKGCSHYDLPSLLHVLDRRFLDLAISNLVVLGFSADVAPEVDKINSHNLNILLQGSQSPLGTERSFSPTQDLTVNLPTDIAEQRLQDLKNYLTCKKDGRIKEEAAAFRNPVRDFLQAEWDDLIDLVSLHLSQLQQSDQYTGFSASLLKLTDLSRLEERAKLLSAYLGYDGASHPPDAYRLAAFRKPRGFLLALMREAALENYKYVSDIILHFQVLPEGTFPILLRADAVRLCGLQLIGASWDPETGALQEAVSPLPCAMPFLSVKAQVRSRRTAIDTLSCKSSFLTDVGNLQATPTASHLPVYYCPIYLSEDGESGTWELSDVNIITKVPLCAKLNPALCSLRRVRLVSTL
ncbi:dynein heavy chain domain-containing protein 1-like [Xiphophorus maculatus]|uniref:dynein heavy chain domain-containing protein 1-like n=1 Tax=Xiphophorus maculatus TaxID=8083 RepID=UPI0006D92367|nr:dynein heavy chain domain-containing protein 1-like [Xiphophorus maculatus]